MKETERDDRENERDDKENERDRKRGQREWERSVYAIFGLNLNLPSLFVDICQVELNLYFDSIFLTHIRGESPTVTYRVINNHFQLYTYAI